MYGLRSTSRTCNDKGSYRNKQSGYHAPKCPLRPFRGLSLSLSFKGQLRSLAVCVESPASRWASSGFDVIVYFFRRHQSFVAPEVTLVDGVRFAVKRLGEYFRACAVSNFGSIIQSVATMPTKVNTTDTSILALYKFCIHSRQSSVFTDNIISQYGRANYAW